MLDKQNAIATHHGHDSKMRGPKDRLKDETVSALPESPMRPEVFCILYQQNSENWRYFLEWRHRVMVRVFVSSAAFVLAAQWLISNGLRSLAFAPILGNAIIFLVVYLMDKRNSEVAAVCQRVGMELEKLSSAHTAFFSGYPTKSRLTYGRILAKVYGAGFLICFSLSITAFVAFKTIPWIAKFITTL